MNYSTKTAAYNIIQTPEGNQYRFYCELSGIAVWTTRPFHDEDPDRELMMAWNQEGKQHFNRCHQCGRWVSDVMYNADDLRCVDCSPWKEQPKFCPRCGTPVGPGHNFCSQCGQHLTHQGGDKIDSILK